jgi:hypothetical protein
MNYAKSSSQQNNQISERIDILKNEIKENIAVNENRILIGNVVNIVAVPIGKFKKDFWYFDYKI